MIYNQVCTVAGARAKGIPGGEERVKVIEQGPKVVLY